MSGIQKKLDSLQPYVLSIRYLQGLAVVDAVFKEGWTVPKSEIISIEKGNEEQEYYMFYSQKEDIGIDELLDYVEHIINLNVERELKYELLKETVKELKNLFNKTPLDKLKTLKFKLNDDLIPDRMSEEDLLLDEVESTNPPKEIAIETSRVEVKVKEEIKPKNNTPKSDKKMDKEPKPLMHGDIELPPKGEKIKLEEFEPVNVECNCGPDEVCPNCADQKGY